MPFFLLVALFVGFGLEDAATTVVLPQPDIGAGLAKVLGSIATIAALAFAAGRWAATRIGRLGRAPLWLRKRYAWGMTGLEVLTLVAYAAIVHLWGWPQIVRQGFGGQKIPVIDETLVLLPYIAMQLAIWWGGYPAERAMRSSQASRRQASLSRHLVLRARQSLGLALPMLLIFSLGQDVIEHVWPQWGTSAWSQPAEVVVMAGVMLGLSPLFVRAAWPSYSLPKGPLRDRLERQARRLGFRYTDILVWDTGNVVVNACVTGALPWFRYVLLSDALIESLDPYEISAVFGHELGHIAHRHLFYFGFFFAGSLGLLAMFNQSIDANLIALSAMLAGPDHPAFASMIEATVVLSVIGVYFLVVFGHVSRRFERQADVFGCQSVSCGLADCPPHADLDHDPDRGPAAVVPCPVGIRIFSNALASVATLNGIEPRARSWRHGSIARRIAFLEGLEGKPEAVRTFQRGVSRLRFAVAGVLIALALIAVASGTISWH